MAVLALGFAALAGILYYASTVDGRPPTVVAISLTQHLSGDAEQALTTVLAMREERLGGDHPEAIATRIDIAQLRGSD